jgi:murein DD-endopeptidase MepM/ murein hydrolase activator NlpD
MFVQFIHWFGQRLDSERVGAIRGHLTAAAGMVMRTVGGTELLSRFTRSERIIIVEDDRVRSVVIGPRQRLRPTAILLMAFTGTLMVALGWVLTAVELHRAREMTGYVQAGADALALQLADARAKAATLGDELHQVRADVSTLKAADTDGERRLSAVLAMLEAAGDPDSSSRTLRQAVTVARTELLAMKEAGSAGTLAGLTQRLDGLTAAMPADSRSVDLGSVDAATAPATEQIHAATAGLARALSEAESRAARLVNEATIAQADRSRALEQVAAAERRVVAVTEGQVALLARLTERADSHIDDIETELKATGINLDAALAELEHHRFGQGGPLIALPRDAQDLIPPAASEAMAQLELRLARQARLRALTTVLPLTAPIDAYYISSGYGRRSDPFTRQWAMHEGIDLAGSFRMPVMATAPGMVVDVAWDNGYGNYVDIDHGFGVRTRYGHLDKAMARVGDRVSLGDRIGLLGNTGRSSGNHLHYEVQVDGKPVNPLRFMEKGRHVCEG